jgi:hemerythrin
MSLKHDARRAQELVAAIKPILAGEKPSIQGAALADLLAMWLAGHVAVGDPKASEAIRETMLATHIEAVRGLVRVEYHLTIEPELKRRMN